MFSLHHALRKSVECGNSCFHDVHHSMMQQYVKPGLSVQVWVAQGGEPHQAHVQSTCQAYMRELEFHIDPTAGEGIDINYHNYDSYDDDLPLYIDRGCFLGERFQKVMNDAKLQLCCGHVCRD